jgi:hypothetical protein
MKIELLRTPDLQRQLCEVVVINTRLCLGGVDDIAPRQNCLQNYQKMTDS